MVVVFQQQDSGAPIITTMRAPPGYHPTAASDPEELAPMLFDSHLLYDSATATIHYAHNAARDADLLYDTLGAAGVCRAPTVGMPMFNANTNRVCTRAPLDVDTPHLPVDQPKVARGWAAEESCAESHRDTPWSASLLDDPQSLSVGGIPEWQRHAAMDGASATLYPFAAFPPPGARLTPLLHGAADCAPVWGAAPPCDACPAGTACLTPDSAPVDGAAEDGVCFSIAAFSERRQPCFRTHHCPDGMVCLADGGCSPLHLHVWNRAASGGLEFTVLADECGFQEGGHPYTQSTRGASPWEQVPDVLHMHGLCSHRDWFAYRHALRTQTCPLLSTRSGLECNASITRWPWVRERFDRQSALQQQTMEAGRALFTVPHPCDESFMHLQAPTTAARLKVCSGTQGQQATPPAMVYGLSADGGWGASPLDSSAASNDNNNPGLARWMRTYSEPTGAVHVGVLSHTGKEDVPLGFLGADAGLDGPMGDMAFGNVRFFRCADRMACQNPPFTYNGLQVERIDPATGSGNFSEVSLRRCGAIGYLAAEWNTAQNAAGICWLDMDLFPVFAQVVWGKRGSGGCAALWSAVDGSVIIVETLTPEHQNAAGVHASPRSFFCDASPASSPEAGRGGRCAYAARGSTRLDASSEQDSVSMLTESLNALLRASGRAVLWHNGHDAQT